MKKLYSTKEATEILGYSNPSIIRTYIERGKIKARKIGRDWMIDQKEINRLLANKK